MRLYYSVLKDPLSQKPPKRPPPFRQSSPDPLNQNLFPLDRNLGTALYLKHLQRNFLLNKHPLDTCHKLKE